MKRKEVEKSVDRHIRIWDTILLEQIDKIMEYPEYKSFSKVINDALFYGLPKTFRARLNERYAGLS